jgi:hypothetical protein
LGKSASGVHKAISGLIGLIEDAELIKGFEDIKTSVLSATEALLLANMVDSTKLEKANLNNVAYAFTQVHQANRLERGQSTQNLAGIYALVSQIDKKERQKPNDTE